MRNLLCVECGQSLLSDENLRLYKKGKKHLKREGCVIKPKKINEKEYYRNKCYECFEKKFKRKPKKMNLANYDMCFLMDVPIEEIKKHRHKTNVVTENRLIERHGKVKGTLKWEEYKKRQSLTNTFEYKKKTYGWTKDMFDEYNKNRAVTIERCVERHGLKKGTKIFREYCEKQSYAGCRLEYFVDKFGEVVGTKKYKDLNEKKRLTRNNFIRKYGKDLGIEKFESYIQKAYNCFSYKANGLFDKIDKFINLKTYYQGNDRGEYGMWLKELNSYVKVDYFVLELNKAIEYYGDYWHTNPLLYEETYYNSKVKLTAKEIKERDEKRLVYLKREYNIDVLVIWEKDHNENEEKVIEKCLKFLEG